MHFLNSVFLVLYTLILTEVVAVKWTLHKSCYTDDSGNPDDDLAHSLMEAFEVVQAWASKGAQKLGDAASGDGGKETRSVVEPLIGKGDFAANANDVKAKFEKFATLDGPVGGDSTDPNKKFDQSDAWLALANDDNDEHFNNFLIVCRADIDEESSFDPYDQIRRRPITVNSDLHKLWKQSMSGTKWNDFQGTKIQAVTEKDESPEGERKKIPQVIYFNSAWIAEQKSRDPPFSAWTDQLFKDVIKRDALTTFAAKGKGKAPGGGDVDVRPVDALLSASFHRNLFHELFHLKTFGDMKDDPNGAYNYGANSDIQNRENPDLLAIIAVVIELVKTQGYIVRSDGAVKKKGLFS